MALCAKTGKHFTEDDCDSCRELQRIAAESRGKNVWGTPRHLINADEFCPDCEREVPWHYDNCPRYGH